MRLAKYHQSAAIGLSLALAAACPISVSAESLGFFEARRVLKEADRAMVAGRHEDAVELYGRIIQDEGAKKREHALYQSAVASLAKEPADFEAAQSFLNELSSSFERSLEGASVPVLKHWIANAGKSASPPVVPEPEPCPEVDAQQDAVKDLRVVRRQNAKLRGELSTVKEQLAQKEEALEKLKAVVVGGGG